MALTPHELVIEAKSHIKEITIDGAVQEAANGTMILDVREPFEFEAGRIANSINIPRGLLEFKTLDHPALAAKDVKIVIYCRTGGRSALAAYNLVRLGYTGVMSMDGGVEAWGKQGHALVTDTTSYS